MNDKSKRQTIQGKGMGFSDYTVEDMIKCVPVLSEKIKGIMATVKRRRDKRKDMSEAEKFALGLPECSFEDEVLITMGLKLVKKDGTLTHTRNGLNMGVAIFTIKNKGEKKQDAIKKQKAVRKRKQEKKNKKKGRKSNKK